MSNDVRLPVAHALSQQVQDNFLAYHRHFAGLPGITLVESDVTWMASEGPPADGITVLGTHLTLENVDAGIDEALRQIGRYSDATDWMVFAGCRPLELGDHFRARGDAGGPDGEWMLYGDIGGPGGNWMWLDLAELPVHVPVPSGFYTKQVTDHAMLDEWIEINARGFGCADYSAFHAAYARHGFGDDAEAIHFTGYMEDTPVTSGTLLVAGGSGSVYNVSTPMDLRRHGFGGAITHAALQEAIHRGFEETWIWASSLGKSVYEKLGFCMADFGVREYQWKKRGT